MNPHSLAESVRQFLQERLPGIPVHTSLDNGELRLPYLLVQASADSEIVPGNSTWELTLALELHTSAHETDGPDARTAFAEALHALCKHDARLELNAAAPDFHLYALRLTLLDRAEVQDDSFVQHASLRAVAQF